MRVIALLALCLVAATVFCGITYWEPSETSNYLDAIGIPILAKPAAPSDSQRIVGGSLTNIGQYPTLAALLYTPNWVSFMQNCGGTILNNKSILTAAHCTINHPPARWRVRVGSTFANSGGVVHDVSAIFNHPSYGSGFMFNNDIAVLHVAGQISYNSNVQPGSIAGSNYNVPDNAVVWTAGWGTISSGGPLSEQLRHVQIWTINQGICNSRYGGIISASMLCSGWLDVGGRDACQNDSGGPLYHNGVVVGVVSFGTGCGHPFYPGVNARVSHFTSWILSHA